MNMKRKIVQHGSSSLTITLPNKWVEKFHIKKGDEVEVEEAGPTLCVMTTREISPRKKTITQKDGPFTKDNLSHLYQLGYDELEIEITDDATLQAIKERLPQCIGFELIDQKEGKVVIKSIATTIEAEFDTLLRKSFLLVDDMGKELLQALKEQNYKNLHEIRNLEALNNKFTDTCIRILNKRGYSVPARTMQMYEIVKTIERIADEYKCLCDLAQEYGKKIEKPWLTDLEKTNEYYQALYHLFYHHDLASKKMLTENYAVQRKSLTSLLEKTKGAHTRFVHLLLNILERTHEGFGSYSALTL